MRLLFTQAVLAVCAVMASAANLEPRDRDSRNFLITFGDSYTKTGFDPSRRGTPRPRNPLGNPAQPGVTSSGGANWVGYMVSSEFNNSMAYSRDSLTVSYNFARSGATVNSNLIPSPHDFVSQVDMFAQYYKAGPRNGGWQAANAVAGVWFGVNDIRSTFYNNGEDALLVSVMSSYFNQLDRLYNLGVRKFIIFSAAPFNMAPNFQHLHDKRARRLRSCIHTWDNLLASGWDKFRRRHGDVVGQIVDSSAPFRRAFQNYKALGVQNPTCSDKDGVSCLWWDGLHPATKVMRLVAGDVAQALRGNTYRCYHGGC